jgi:transcriptional regulator with XRE-family HTH domain
MGRPRASHPSESLPDQLRRAIRDSGLTWYALAQLADVDRQQLRRFAAGAQGLTLDTAGRLAAALELDLVRRRPRAAPAYARRQSPTPTPIPPIAEAGPMDDPWPAALVHLPGTDPKAIPTSGA